MALITPEELIVFLDLPDDTQPTDRATLICTLVIDAVNKVAGQTLAEPFPTGLKGIAMAAAGRLYTNPIQAEYETVGAVSTRYGSRNGILTDAEKTEVGGLVDAARARYEFPGTWPFPDPVERTADAVTG